MPVSAERIRNDLAALACFTQTPGKGIVRPTFSGEWRAARDYIATQAESIGCRTRVDAFGNLHARPSAIGWMAPAWMSGSFLSCSADEPSGAVGVVAALETLRAAREDLKVACPLEVVVWAGTADRAFPAEFIGSRAYVGELTSTDLTNLKNARGQTYLEAGAPHGVVPDKFAEDARAYQMAIGYIELTVDDLSRRWPALASVSVVPGVAGRRRYRVTLSQPPQSTEHAPIHQSLAELILALETIAHDAGISLQLGTIDLQPNALDHPPTKVSVEIDWRTVQMTVLASSDQQIRKAIEKIAAARKITAQLDLAFSQTVSEADARVCAKLIKSADACRLDLLPKMAAGRPHDAFAVAGHIPSAMLFVPRSEGADADPATIAAATCLLLETVRDRRLE